jgi:hypothetical protein
VAVPGRALGSTGSRGDNAQGRRTDSTLSSPPAISLPKGGGAIREIGEKFTANPVSGTASLSVPIHTSPGRSGFGPQLSLSYDSGAGNGPFGWGWSLSLPTITRKTDKGLPRYRDAEESDIFILSGAEDLVPVLVESGGQWRREANGEQEQWRRMSYPFWLYGDPGGEDKVLARGLGSNERRSYCVDGDR